MVLLYNIIDVAMVAELADAQDSDSCELKLHVGSTPIRRTIFLLFKPFFVPKNVLNLSIPLYVIFETKKSCTEGYFYALRRIYSSL